MSLKTHSIVQSDNCINLIRASGKNGTDPIILALEVYDPKPQNTLICQSNKT